VKGIDMKESGKKASFMAKVKKMLFIDFKTVQCFNRFSCLERWDPI